ncbi:MAG: ChbG/HpnK family deacetylase [Bacteroidales bacterium]|nr:ChbG/HpnK family deacetylase [Bacteroidales bacterium]
MIVRGDDIGSARSSNLAIIDDFKNGMISTTEIMVPAPWFNEAALMLTETPDLDVGIHLVLTSEWTYFRWRPLTSGLSFRDKEGIFYPNVWGGNSLQTAKLDYTEIEAELGHKLNWRCRKFRRLPILPNTCILVIWIAN